MGETGNSGAMTPSAAAMTTPSAAEPADWVYRMVASEGVMTSFILEARPAPANVLVRITGAGPVVREVRADPHAWPGRPEPAHSR
jgi:hypothetical protein